MVYDLTASEGGRTHALLHQATSLARNYGYDRPCQRWTMGDARAKPATASDAQSVRCSSWSRRRCLARGVDSAGSVWLPRLQRKCLCGTANGFPGEGIRKPKSSANTAWRYNGGMRRGNFLPWVYPTVVGSHRRLTFVHGCSFRKERHSGG